jgi:hypothetical protein
LKQCAQCRANKLAYKKTTKGKAAAKRYNASDVGKARTNRANTSEAGKAAKKRYSDGEAGKAATKRYNASDVGKARTSRANTSEAGKAAKKRYSDGEAAKASRKRYKESETGKASTKRSADKRMERRQQSPAMRLDATILSASNHLICGRRQTSPTFLERTALASENAFLAVVSASCAANGFDFDGHGVVWELDHKIPREAYDFGNPDDVKRCWSASNLHAMTLSDNREKSWKLIDYWITSAGPSCFPAAWNGAPPTEEMKKAHHDNMLAEKALADAAAVKVASFFDDSSDDEFEGGREACGYESESSSA